MASSNVKEGPILTSLQTMNSFLTYKVPLEGFIDAIRDPDNRHALCTRTIANPIQIYGVNVRSSPYVSPGSVLIQKGTGWGADTVIISDRDLSKPPAEPKCASDPPPRPKRPVSVEGQLAVMRCDDDIFERDI